TYTFVLQDKHGQVSTTHSVSAGLDYPAVGPEHAYLRERGRVAYTSASDEEALEAARVLAEQEGIIPALEPAHALADLLKRAPKMRKEEIVVVNLSGRGDKDMDILGKHHSPKRAR
ncbi:MAG: tryptophan synthase subunit beta, partial [Candidatus Acidiferrales bacterium]